MDANNTYLLVILGLAVAVAAGGAYIARRLQKVPEAPTPESRASDDLLDARMRLLEACKAQEIADAQVAMLRARIARLEHPASAEARIEGTAASADDIARKFGVRRIPATR